MAWKTPGFTIENTSVEEPRNDGSTATLRKSTETIMMTMDTKAIARVSDSGISTCIFDKVPTEAG